MIPRFEFKRELLAIDINDFCVTTNLRQNRRGSQMPKLNQNAHRAFVLIKMREHCRSSRVFQKPNQPRSRENLRHNGIREINAMRFGNGESELCSLADSRKGFHKITSKDAGGSDRLRGESIHRAGGSVHAKTQCCQCQKRFEWHFQHRVRF